MEKHTYQAGLIGNCSYLAHVNINTNITWLCWPRFDSSFVFGGLLDKDKGGEFSILPATEHTPQDNITGEYQYSLHGNLLRKKASYRITDFAPRFKQFERGFSNRLCLSGKLNPLMVCPG